MLISSWLNLLIDFDVDIVYIILVFYINYKMLEFSHIHSKLNEFFRATYKLGGSHK